MKSKKAKSNAKSVLIFVLLTSIILSFIACINTATSRENAIKLDRAVNITDDIFYYSNGNKMQSDGKMIKASSCDKMTVYFKLDSINAENNKLLIQTKVREVTSVTCNGIKLDTTNYKVDSGRHTYWTLIDLNGATKDSVVNIQLSSSDRTSHICVKTAYSGTGSSLLLEILYHYLLILLFIAIEFFIGIAYTISGLISLIRFKNKNASFVIYFGLFFILFSLWQLSDFEIITAYANQAAFDVVGNAAFMLFAVPLMQFTNTILEKRSKIIDILSVAMIVNYGISSLAYHFGNIPFTQTVELTYILMILCSVSSGLVVILNLVKKKNITFILSSIGILILVATSAFISLYYIYPDMLNVNATTVTLIASSIMFIAFLADLSMTAYGIQTVQKNADYYKEVAFVDNSTDVASKAAYNDYIKNVDYEQLSSVGILVIDINNLKKINDTQGHQAGDSIIRSAAIMIKDAFTKSGTTFRYGGDEFVVICENKSKADIEKYFNDLSYLVDFYNSRYELKLDFAFGIADDKELSGPMSKEKFDKVFNLADKRMYIMKKQSKTKR